MNTPYTLNQSTNGFIDERVWNYNNNKEEPLDGLKVNTIKIQRFESDQRRNGLPTNRNDNTPVNIIIMDGGGMRGYAFLPMMEALEELSEEFGGNFISKVDLIGGTSVGGVAALIAGTHETNESLLSEGRAFLNEVRKKWACKISILKTWARGKAVKKRNEIRTLANQRFGDRLLSDGVIHRKAFAVCTARLDYQASNQRSRRSRARAPYVPFIARNYNEYPEVEGCEVLPLCKHGSSDMRFADAVGATAGVPGIARRIRIQTQEGEISLADGALVCNCPVSIGIDEARCLFPNRPIGVVLSLGLDELENDVAQRAVDIARLSDPGIHYQRIKLPEKSMVWLGQTKRRKLERMEEEVKKWILDDEYRRALTRQTVKRMFRWNDNVNVVQEENTMSPRSVIYDYDNVERSVDNEIRTSDLSDIEECPSNETNQGNDAASIIYTLHLFLLTLLIVMITQDRKPSIQKHSRRFTSWRTKS